MLKKLFNKNDEEWNGLSSLIPVAVMIVTGSFRSAVNDRQRQAAKLKTGNDRTHNEINDHEPAI